MRFLGYIFALSAFIGAIFWYGYTDGKQSQEWRIEQLEGAISANNALSNKLKQEGIQNEKKLSEDWGANVIGINAYYERLLQRQDSHGNSTTTANPERTYGTACQQTVTGCPAGIEQKCALDAQRIIEFQKYIIDNKIPIF